MTRYYTEVANELLPNLANERMPPTLRLICEIEPTDYGTTIVEIEDDEADVSMAGRMVTPTISQGFPDGDLSRLPGIWVSGYDVGPAYTHPGQP